MSAHPEIRWAQRSSEDDESKNVLLVSIMVPDLNDDYKLDIQPSKLSFSGNSRSQKQQFGCDLELFGEVVPEQTKKATVGKGLFLTLQKKELKMEYWPRLTKDKKVMFVKTDFEKWRDEDEQEGEANIPGDDMPDMAQMGAGGGGMPPGMMGGMPGMPGMMGGGGGGGGGLPEGMDMEKLMAQMNAMGGAGAMGGGAPGGDDDMPPLDDDDSTADSKGKGKATDDMPPLE